MLEVLRGAALGEQDISEIISTMGLYLTDTQTAAPLRHSRFVLLLLLQAVTYRALWILYF